MKKPSSFLTNTTAPAGRAHGQAIDDPGGGTGTGVDNETYNDPAYGLIALIDAFKEGGITDTDEKTTASDVLDALNEALGRRVIDPVTPGNDVDEWLVGTNYTTVGDLVFRQGKQYVNFNGVGNLGLDPVITRTHWYPIPSLERLLDLEASGEILHGGFSDLADIQHAKYQQNIEFGRFRVGGNGGTYYNFYRVALDGTQVTGDATLVAIFDVGGGDEYWNIDIVAPDVLGTRTLLDKGGRSLRDMTGVGGVAATLGEVQEDQMQGHAHSENVGPDSTNADGGLVGAQYRAARDNSGSNINMVATTQKNDNAIDTPISDGTNGTPRTGLETRVKAIVEGAGYIIVMLAA